MANREPTKTQIFEVDSEVKTTKTTVTNQAYNEPDKRASEQMLDTEEPGKGVRLRNLRKRCPFWTIRRDVLLSRKGHRVVSFCFIRCIM